MIWLFLCVQLLPQELKDYLLILVLMPLTQLWDGHTQECLRVCVRVLINYDGKICNSNQKYACLEVRDSYTTLFYSNTVLHLTWLSKILRMRPNRKRLSHSGTHASTGCKLICCTSSSSPPAFTVSTDCKCYTILKRQRKDTLF